MRNGCFGDLRMCVDEFLGARPMLETLLALLYRMHTYQIPFAYLLHQQRTDMS